MFVAGGAIIEWGGIDVSRAPFLHAAFPVGVILLGLAGLSKLFDREERIYGEDQRHEIARATGLTVKHPPADMR